MIEILKWHNLIAILINIIFISFIIAGHVDYKETKDHITGIGLFILIILLLGFDLIWGGIYWW
jgi:hypothetical protein